MRRVTSLLVLSVFALIPAWSQTKSETSKQREVLTLYGKFVEVEQRLQQLEKRSTELQKDLDAFLESDSPLKQLAGVAMLVGALKAWSPEIRDAIAEEDSLITKLVTASAGVTGDAQRHADEGVRLLREQHVYLKQSLDLYDELVKDLTQALRVIGEERLADFPEILDEQHFKARLKTIEELDQKQELTRARAKDAFSRLKAIAK